MSLLVHTGDWHVDRKTLGVARRHEVEQAAVETVQYAVQKRAAAWVFTGDLCDPEDGAEVERAIAFAIGLARWLDDEGIDSVWMPGNHDVFHNGTGRSVLTPLTTIGRRRVLVAEWPKEVRPGGIRLLALPYCSDTGPHRYEPVEAVRGYRSAPGVREDGRIVVATHLSFEGAQLGEESREMARGRDVQFPWQECDPRWTIIGGHYHRRQVIEGPGGRRAFICGAPARLTFGEASNVPAFTALEV